MMKMSLYKMKKLRDRIQNQMNSKLLLKMLLIKLSRLIYKILQMTNPKVQIVISKVLELKNKGQIITMSLKI